MLESLLAKISVSPARPTLYIQYCNKEIKELMAEIQRRFEQNSWNAPGIEYIQNGCDNSIRYFHEEDRTLANQANILLGNKYNIKKSSLRAPKGQIELWAEN